ncbi:MAG: hypothetical protein P6D49_04075 [Acidimicrobiales bacterium]|nr:hypothetical protein [Acidimicrobiales bacterium]
MDDLLAVQHEDTTADQIRHRLANLPERVTLETALGERRTNESDRDVLRLERLELDRRQKRAEADVEAVASRIQELDDRLYGSGISSPREAREIQEEVERLKPRQEDLEERVLEVFEEIDPVDGRLGELDARAEAGDATIAAARAALALIEAGLGDDLAQAEERRHVAASEVPADVLGRYEGLRGMFGASTVVQFDGSDCRGCPSAMPAVEVDRVKHLEEGSLTDCTECGRLVVR